MFKVGEPGWLDEVSPSSRLRSSSSPSSQRLLSSLIRGLWLWCSDDIERIGGFLKVYAARLRAWSLLIKDCLTRRIVKVYTSFVREWLVDSKQLDN